MGGEEKRYWMKAAPSFDNHRVGILTPYLKWSQSNCQVEYVESGSLLGVFSLCG